MSVKERLIQFVLRGKDELSPAAEKASEAMAELAKEAEELGKALDTAKESRRLIQELKTTERELALAEAASERAAKRIEQLRKELDEAPKSKGLVASLREAEKQFEQANKRIDNLRPALADVSTALNLAGVDTKQLATEEKRLAEESAKAQQALKANADKRRSVRADEAAASRAAAEAERDAATASTELEGKKKAAAVAARELLQRQREGAQATAEHSNQIGISIKRLAAYAAGLLGVGQVLGKLREGITAVFRSGNDNEQALAQLNAALASTGNAAGLTAEQLQDLAEQLRSSSLFSAEQIVAAETRLLSYTDVAAEEFPRAMQIVVDQAQRLGMSIEQSAETVGKALQSPAEAMAALGRQGFKLEAGQKELLQQLVATGRTAEAQAVIMDMLAESYGGAAAAARLDTATGLWKRLTDQLGDFAGRVADSGSFDYLKQKLKELGDYLQALADDGTLERWAKQASDALVSLARNLENAGRWVARHSTELKAMAAAYAALKLAGMVTAMARWATSVQGGALQMRALTLETNAAAAATSRLGAAQVLASGMGKMGASVLGLAKGLLSLTGRLAGWAGIAMLAVDAGKPLGEMFAKMTPAVKEAEASIERLKQQMREQYEAAKVAAQGLEDAAGVQFKSSSELRRASDEERDAYKQRLLALEAYRKAQLRVALLGREVGAASADDLKQAQQGLAAVQREMKAIEKAADFTADAFKGRLTTGALELVEQFNAVRRSGKDAEEALAELGKSFDPSNANQLRDMGVLLQYLGQYGVLSGEQIQQFLIAKLDKLSGEDLLKVQQVAKEVFDGLGRGAGALGMVVDASLGRALQKLGIDLEEVHTGFDKATRDTLEAFGEVIRVQQESGRSAQESAAVIAAAYVAARQKIDDPAALEQLDAAFKVAAQTAGMTATEISTSMAKARGDVEKASGAIRDMGDALSRISDASSTMELANIGVAASKAFHDGRMSAEQYAKVQDALRDKARELKGAIEETGEAGEQAGEKLLRSQEMYNDALKDGIVTNEELRRISGQRMEEERKGLTDLQDNSKRDMSAMEGFFSGVMTRAREPLASMSRAALEAYDRMRGLTTMDMSIDTSGLDATRGSLEKVTKALGEVQQALSSPLTSSLGRWAAETQRASLQTQQAFLSQKAALQGLLERYQSGAIDARKFVQSANAMRHSLSLLDDSDLSGLESAIKSAKDQMQALTQSTQGTLNSMMDELDGLQGRTEDIERRRFQSRRQELQTQLAEANAKGDAQAIANASKALGLLRQIEDETAQKRQREEQQKRIEANTSSAPAKAEPTATPSAVVRFESPRGGPAVDVAVADGDQTRLLSILADAGLRSL